MSTHSLIAAIQHERDTSILYQLRGARGYIQANTIPLPIVEYVYPHVEFPQDSEKYYYLASLLATIRLRGDFTTKSSFGKALKTYDQKTDSSQGRMYLRLLDSYSQELFLLQVEPWIENLTRQSIPLNPYDLAEAVVASPHTWKNKKQYWAEQYFTGKA